jgi:hypothetical protein
MFDKATLTCILLVLTACAPKDAPPAKAVAPSKPSPTLVTPATIARVSLRLVDQHMVEEGEEDPYFRIEIRGARTDTVRSLWTTDEPALIGDSTILGTLSDILAKRTHFFRYRIASHTLDTIAMPALFHDAFSGIAVSPDGQYLAWANLDHNGHAVAEIRTFPRGEIVSRSSQTAVSPSDGRLAHPHWASIDSAVISVWADVVPNRPWIQYRFVPAIHAWHVDTLRNGQ